MTSLQSPVLLQDPRTLASLATQPAAARAVVHRSSGSRHGAITRLMSPGDLGQFVKPFVFLDYIATQSLADMPKFGMHPHSGIATLTFLMQGEVRYEHYNPKTSWSTRTPINTTRTRGARSS